MDQLVRQQFGRIKIEDGPKNYLKFYQISRLKHIYKVDRLLLILV